ncbi:MAG TPA: hypothetical protein VMS93_12435 [Candidatus Saccharimonadales bacterium]|nr:hypothetical protein [Candidatus Saccharimonadales bacterium]
MSLVTRFSAVFCVAQQLERVRPLAPGETVGRATRADVPALLEVARRAHGSGGRSRETLEQRLDRGLTAHLLRQNGTPAAYLWVGRGSYSIFPLRLRLVLPPGAGYVFDETTDPAFRRQGMLGKLLASAWQTEGLDLGVACIATSNVASLAANGRVGFRPDCTVALSRWLVWRVHSVRGPHGASVGRFHSLVRPGHNPVALQCAVHRDGLRDFRLAHDAEVLRPRPGAPDWDAGMDRQ